MLARSLTASERERKSIAGDVHDGPVQDLAGVAYALAALRPNVPADQGSAVDSLGAAVRDAVAWLRRLMAELYPPDLSPAALAAALEDLGASARSTDVEVDVDVDPVADVVPETAAVLYRTAKQALDEAVALPGHHRIWVHYGPASDGGEPAVRLQIDDDRGTATADDSVADGDAPQDGDDPMDVLRAPIEKLGGTLVVVRRAGRGSLVTAVVPSSS
jgi:signal transduction histidine kinase